MTSYNRILYKTLVGGYEIYILSPNPNGDGGDTIQDAVVAMADAIEGWTSATKGISSASKTGETLTFTYSDNTTQDFTVPNGTPGTSPSASVSKSGTTATITITDATGTTTTTVSDGAAGADGASAQWTLSSDTTSTACSAALALGTWFYFSAGSSSLTVTSSLTFGQSSAVEFSSPATATTYTGPSGCSHYGDACDGGDFTPAASKTYQIVYLQTASKLTAYVKEL